MITLLKLRCYNKLEFIRSMKIHSKDQTKKMEDENVETWAAKNQTLEKP
jgi:hypothetical protein